MNEQKKREKTQRNSKLSIPPILHMEEQTVSVDK